MIDITPPKVKQFHTRQPGGDNPAVAPLPTTQLLTAQSNSGKGVLLSNLFLNPKLYRGKFQRIFCFSHSMFTDCNWKELMKYSEEVMQETMETIVKEVGDKEDK